MRIADALRPRAILLENVEGLYSSNGGRDFGVVLDALAERGYLVSWRTLDSQHFGVPQRRRRVFVCAIADGDPGAERIGEVLALQEGGGGDSPTSDPSWPLTAAGAAGGAGSGGRVVGTLTATYGEQSGQDLAPGRAGLVTHDDLPIGVTPGNPNIAGTIVGNGQGGQRTTDIAGAYVYRKSARVSGPGTPETWVDDGVANTLNNFDVGDVRTTHAVVEFSHTQGLDAQPREDGTPTLRKSGGGMAVGISENQRGELRETPYSRQLTTGGGKPGQGYPAARIGSTVRRLTPMECERLQGWPDNWTDIPWNGNDHAPDSRRYSAAGNGVTATVAWWIGARLAEVLK